ncbi:hypothetical protein E4U34_005420 [Claviceps purpurea]|nr:hypothetical protein E4U34_005420 [Claviceps purpurea]KAG6306314.1 hypothetical protein E4U44_008061 [Claviceps purpurea]
MGDFFLSQSLLTDDDPREPSNLHLAEGPSISLDGQTLVSDVLDSSDILNDSDVLDGGDILNSGAILFSWRPRQEEAIKSLS